MFGLLRTLLGGCCCFNFESTLPLLYDQCPSHAVQRYTRLPADESNLSRVRKFSIVTANTDPTMCLYDRSPGLSLVMKGDAPVFVITSYGAWSACTSQQVTAGQIATDPLQHVLPTAYKYPPAAVHDVNYNNECSNAQPLPHRSFPPGHDHVHQPIHLSDQHPPIPTNPTNMQPETPLPESGSLGQVASADSSSQNGDVPGSKDVGWFEKCRGCMQLTAHEASVEDKQIPFCRRCQQRLLQLPEPLLQQASTRLLQVHAAWAEAGF